MAAAFEPRLTTATQRLQTRPPATWPPTKKLALADWLAGAIAKPTHARYLAARSIVAGLEETWAINHGRLPSAPWKGASADPAAMEQFRKVLKGGNLGPAEPAFLGRLFRRRSQTLALNQIARRIFFARAYILLAARRRANPHFGRNAGEANDKAPRVAAKSRR